MLGGGGFALYDFVEARVRREYDSGAPDMTLRELFFHIDPDVTGTVDKQATESGRERWEQAGLEIRDNLSTGQLKAWGRRVDEGPMASIIPTEYSLQSINPNYWPEADFTYWFLYENYQDRPQVEPHQDVKGRYKFTDVRLNRREVMRIWPRKPR